MAKFTLLEVHLDGSEVTANAPFSTKRDAESPTESESAPVDVETPADESDGVGGPGAVILGLVVLVVAVVVLRRLLGGDSELTGDEPA